MKFIVQMLAMVSLSVLVGCHHGTKTQTAEPEAMQEAQVIMTFKSNGQAKRVTEENIAVMDLADFAYRH